MLNFGNIQDVVQRVVAAAHSPSRVILFGSYARGEAREDSDLDLIVVEREVANVGEEMLRLQDAIGWPGTDVDVLVYSESEYEMRKDWCSTPVYWAVREGKVLYDHLERSPMMSGPSFPITNPSLPITTPSCC